MAQDRMHVYYGLGEEMVEELEVGRVQLGFHKISMVALGNQSYKWLNKWLIFKSLSVSASSN
jgi:hypothetical protein